MSVRPDSLSHCDCSHSPSRDLAQLLRVLSFDMSVTLPHVFVLRLARELEVSDALAGHAFYVANDSLCTRLCLQYKPEKVACAVLHLAAEILGLTGPSTF